MPFPQQSGPTQAGPVEQRRRRRRTLQTRKTLLLLILLASLFVLGAAHLAYQDATAWVDHTNEVKLRLGDLDASLMLAESSEVGFLITGGAPALRAYRTGRSEVRPLLGQIARLTADNPMQQAQLAMLRPLVEAKLDHMAALEQIAREQGVRPARDAFAARSGNRLMERIRQRMEAMDDTEDSLLSRRADRARTVGSLLLLIVAGLTVVIPLSALLGYRAVEAEYRREREDAEALSAALAEMRTAKDEAERANRAKSVFLASVNHDLRQPLQAMLLVNTALAGRLAGHPAEPMTAQLELAVDAMKTLLDSLLDVSRLDAGVVKPEIAAIPLGPLLQRLVRDHRAVAAAKALELRHVPTGLWVRTDPELLARALANLLDNAIRFTEHGAVLLGCRRRRSGAGGKVEIWLLDTGIGIPPEHQAAVFQDFFQLGNPERDRAKGLGLGLAVVRRLADLLGHDLSLRSQPGSGTTVVLGLPEASSAEAAAAGHGPRLAGAAALAAALPAVATVLVIDDEAMVRDSLRTLLSDWGYRVLVAEDGEEAVRHVLGGPSCPDLILADYRLRGGETGVAAALAVHSACGRPVRTVVLTGDTAPERVAEVHRSGFAIAHKPLRIDQLRSLL